MAKSKVAEKPSWTEATAELEEILREIEDESLDIDALGPRVERAALLIRACRDVLVGTEMRVREAIASLEEEGGESEEGDA